MLQWLILTRTTQLPLLFSPLNPVKYYLQHWHMRWNGPLTGIGNICHALLSADKNMVSVWHTHAHTVTQWICAFWSDKAAAYAVADTVTCGDWLRLETKAGLKNLISTSESLYLPQHNGSRFLNCQHPQPHGSTWHSFIIQLLTWLSGDRFPLFHGGYCLL